MLHLYKEISPNTDDKHYYFTTPTQYKTAIANNLVKSVTLDNYRINTNIIKVALDDTLTEAIADTLTYAIDERVDDNVITYFRAYHVNRIAIQSGYVVLYCSVDNWASYFYKASIDNLVITRCNRKIGNGIYEDIKIKLIDFTNKTLFIEPTNLQLVLFVKRTNTNNVYIMRRSIETIVNESGLQTDNDLIKVENFINNIGRLRFKGTTSASAFDIEIFNAYIVPYELLSNSDYSDTSLQQAQAWFDYEIKNTTTWVDEAFRRLIPSYNIVQYTILKEHIEQHINDDIYIGTNNNFMKVPRLINKDVNFNFIFTLTYEDISLLIGYNENTRDISNNLKLNIYYLNNETSGLIRIDKSLNNIGNIFLKLGNTAKNVVSQNYLGVVSDIISTTSEITSEDNNATSYTATGDALTTYGQNLDNFINLFYAQSIENEEAKARLYGGLFNEKIDLNNIFEYSLLGSGMLTDTYVKANCNIDKIPTEASDIIKAKLNSGIYLINLNT